MSKDLLMREMDYAKSVLDNGYIRYSPYTTVLAVAKYYINEQKMRGEELEKELTSFCVLRFNYRYKDASDMARIISSRVGKSSVIDIEYIGISNSEMQIINSQDNKQKRRLLFSMLCLAKYYDTIEPKNNHWVNVPIDNVIELSNIKCSVDNSRVLMGDLYDDGLITVNKKYIKINNRVNFIDNADSTYRIYSMSNLGKQYDALSSGKKIIVCQRCDTPVVKASANSREKYCADCAKIINREKALSKYFASKYRYA